MRAADAFRARRRDRLFLVGRRSLIGERYNRPAKPLRNRRASLGCASDQVLQSGFTASSSAGLAREITTEFGRDALAFGASPESGIVDGTSKCHKKAFS
jgi:hypothetical protein